MDKKIILVLLILLVLVIYYCYTHEKFTEKFESGGVGTDTTKAITDLGNIAKQLLAGGATVPGNLTVTSKLNVAGRDILAELDDLKKNVVRKDYQYYLDIGYRADNNSNGLTDKGVIVHGDGYKGVGPILEAWNKNSTTRFSLRQHN
jgi:hypothetical protein